MADRVCLQKIRPAKALQQCDENAVIRPSAGKRANSSDNLIKIPSKAAKITDEDADPSRKIKIGSGSKATRQSTGKKRRDKEAPDKETRPQQKDKTKKRKKKKTKKKQAESSTAHTIAIPVQDDKEAICAPESTAKTRKQLKAACNFVTKKKMKTGRIDDPDNLLDDQYDDEIIEYTRSLEKKMTPDASYMERQIELDWSMRAKLVAYLVNIRVNRDLEPEVLFIAVNYLDRFLSRKMISRDTLQLAGCTALFIASKYECVSQMKKNTIVALGAGTFTVEQLLAAERFMLNLLDFEMGWPGPIGFLERLQKADRKYKNARNMSLCFLDITMIDQRFVSCVPSYLSAGAYCLARSMLGKNDWVIPSTHNCEGTY